MTGIKVTYEDHMGTDLSVVNAAKVSFGKRSEWDERLNHYSEANDTNQWELEGWSFYSESTSGDVYHKLSKKDQSLIQFLARGCTSGDWNSLVNNISAEGYNYRQGYENHLEGLLNHLRKMPSHWSPFAHTAITLHLKMPIFVARQIMKHTTGIEYNEVSRRYVDSEPEFYRPVWRMKADNVKQGSGPEFCAMDQLHINVHINGGEDYVEMMVNYYNWLLDEGVAPEQARMILPQSMFTEVITTGNLYAWANLYLQRSDSHAQKETQEVAKQIGDIIQPLFPVSWEALTK